MGEIPTFIQARMILLFHLVLLLLYLEIRSNSNRKVLQYLAIYS